METFTYKIWQVTQIEKWEQKLLAHLYLPIIGSKALSVYYLLLEESETLKEVSNVDFNIMERLCNLSGLNTTTLLRQLKKLEALGLIETLVNNNKNEWVFSIYPPLEPMDFFETEIFNNTLLKKIGKKNYEIARYVLRENGPMLDKNEYQNVSSKFSDIYNDSIDNIKEKEISKLIAKSKKTNPMFDNLKFGELSRKATEKSINFDFSDLKNQKIIKDVYIKYNFTPDEIFNIILNLSVDNIKINKESILDYLSKIFIDKNNLDDTLNTVKINNIDEIKKNETIKEFNLYTPIDFITELFNGKRIVKKDKNFIYRLQTEYKLKDSIINCLLDFSYWRNDEEIVENYIFKIANSLIDKKIDTLEDVMAYLQKAHKNSNKNKKSFAAKNKEKTDNKFNWEEMSELKSNKVIVEEKIDINELLEIV